MKAAVVALTAALGLLSTAPAGAATRQVTVAAGAEHACAVSAAGTVKCWGLNNEGQVGNGSSGGVVAKPATVAGLAKVIGITAGDDHTCALLNPAGTVKCWGRNDAGELGNGTRTDSSRPVSVKGVGGTGQLSGVKALTAGGDHSCALMKIGTVKCWGQNNEGVLGNGSIKNALTPVSVSGLQRVTTLSMSAQVTCASLVGGTVKCWGYTGDGQLGVGTTGPKECEFGEFTHSCSPTPITVKGVSGVAGVSVGQNEVCAVLKTAKVECWGNNANNAPGPVLQRGLTGVNLVSTSGSNDDHSCALLLNGTVQCFAYNTPHQAPLPFTIKGLSTVKVLSVGGVFNCTVLAAGTVKCFDNNSNSPKPYAVTGL